MNKESQTYEQPDPTRSLYEDVVDYLVYMVIDLRFYGIGSNTAPSEEHAKRNIKNWINKPLAEYINSYLVVKNGAFIKDVDWRKLNITNAVVADLGYLFTNLAVIFKLVDSSSILIEQLFSHCGRAMTPDRNAMGNVYFESIMICKFNPDLMARCKPEMVSNIYEMINLPE